MGFVGIPLSVATFPVEVIALGIAVDDTIHFMTRFSQEIKLTSDNREAIEPHACARSCSRCSTTSVALVIGFSMLCFGQFASTKQFGFLAALTMAVAWFSDLMITPMLLHATPLITAWDLLRLKIGDAGGRSAVPLFRGLKASEVKRVALLGTVTKHAAGELPAAPGRRGRLHAGPALGRGAHRGERRRVERARARSARSSPATWSARWPSSPARAAPRRWSPPRTASTCASTRRGCAG